MSLTNDQLAELRKEDEELVAQMQKTPQRKKAKWPKSWKQAQPMMTDLIGLVWELRKLCMTLNEEVNAKLPGLAERVVRAEKVVTELKEIREAMERAGVETLKELEEKNEPVEKDFEVVSE